MCGLSVVAFGVFCAVRATKIGIATASADEADAVVETGAFRLLIAEKHHNKNHEWCTFELSSDGQPVSADFSGKVSAAHGGTMNADVLLKQFEEHKAGDLVEVRYVYSDVSDTYYLLEVVGPGAAAD
jgi:hypothetical protein